MANTAAVVKKAQQRLHFLRVLRRNNVGEKLLVTFYRSSIQSVLTFCISVWFSQHTEADRRKLQGVINTAQRTSSADLSFLLFSSVYFCCMTML